MKTSTFKKLIRKQIKSVLLNESLAWERKFGEPLPTLKDVRTRHENKLREGEEVPEPVVDKTPWKKGQLYPGYGKAIAIKDKDEFVLVKFKQGEKIHTEISRKYDTAIMNKILQQTDFTIIDELTDGKRYFTDYIMERH